MIGTNAHAPHKRGPETSAGDGVCWIDEGDGALTVPAPGEWHLHWRSRPPGPEPGRAEAARLLARYLDCGAGDVAFAVGPHGRPEIATPRTDLRFNLSHSGGHLLLAVGIGRFGVDVEQVADSRDYLALARHQFRDAELAFVEARPDADHAIAFLRLWTAKEALVKALGLGLAAMREIELAFAGDGSPRPVTLPRAAGDPASWRVVEYAPEAGYRAALAVERP